MVYCLNLPDPSIDLMTSVNEFVVTCKFDSDNQRWLNDYHHNTINAAHHLFTNITTQSINDQLKFEYSKFFQDPICAVIGIMHNAGPQTTACQPPHVDRGRALAINYYLELGGNNVQTVFYAAAAATQSTTAHNYLYSDVEKIGQCCFGKNQWYAYNVTQCHSVEHIQTTRYFLSIMLEESPLTTVEKFLSKNLAFTFDTCPLSVSDTNP